MVWGRAAVDPQITDKFPDLSPSNYFRGTPIMIDGVLYAPDGVGLVEAFDAATGKTKWVQQPVEPTLKEAAGQSTRGVAYWRKGSDERIVSIRGEYLYAIDAKTGAPERDFGENGRISLNRDTPDDARLLRIARSVCGQRCDRGRRQRRRKSERGYGDGGFEAEPNLKTSGAMTSIAARYCGFSISCRTKANRVTIPGAKAPRNMSATWLPGLR